MFPSEDKNPPTAGPPSLRSGFSPRALREPDRITDEETGKTLLIDAILDKNIALVLDLIRAGANLDKTSKNGKTPLHYAALTGFAEAAEALLEAGAQRNPRDKNLETPFFDALKSQAPEVLINLLRSQGCSADIPARGGRIPLHDAAKNVGGPAALKALLAATKNPDRPDGKGATPFLLACRHGSKEAVEAFLYERITVLTADQDGNTCLHLAAARPEDDIAKFLLTGEAARLVNAVNLRGESPLHGAVKMGHKNLIHAMIDVGAVVNLRDNSGVTPLYEAVHTGNKKTAETLILSGADVSKSSGQSPLLTAIRRRDIAMVTLLLDYNADPNQQNTSGISPLMEAAQSGNEKIIELLLERGANAALTDESGGNALHYAGAGITSTAIMRLVRGGADINAHDSLGRTPLISRLSEYNTGDSALEMLKAGADPELPDRQGRTPVLLAVLYRKINLLEELLKKKASPNVADKDMGRTPLHYAALSGMEEEVDMLLAAGAEVSIKDSGGRTPLHCVIQLYGWTSARIVRQLLKNGADPTTEDNRGQSAYDLALSYNNRNVIDLFDQELKKQGRKYTPKYTPPPRNDGPYWA